MKKRGTKERRFSLSAMMALLGEGCPRCVDMLTRSKAIQELLHGIRKTIQIVLVDDVPAIECNEAGIGPPRYHFFDLGLRCKATLAPSNQ